MRELKVWILAGVAFVVVATTQQAAAQIYKWTDENGVVQYTPTPPPKGAQAKQMRVRTGGEKADVPSLLSGNQWTMNRDGGFERLAFDSRGFERYFIAGGEGGTTTRFGGEWTLTGRILLLRYKSHPDPEKIDRPERLMITRIDGSTLELLDDAGKKIVYQGASSSGGVMSAQAVLFHGEWRTDDRMYTYYFSERGDFSIRHRKENGVELEIGQGRWNYAEPYLTLHYNVHRPLEQGLNRSGSDQKLVASALGATSVKLRENGGESFRLVKDIR